MRAAIALGWLALVIGVASSCWVDNRSGDYECSTDTECAGFADDRVCDTAIGFCVPEVCPAACDSCNVSMKTCAINCGQGGTVCGSVSCPDGYACTITCSGTNSCGAVNCADAASCVVNCSGGNMNNPACSNVQCGDGPCNVKCLTDQACDVVDCNNSCKCDVACTLGLSCETATCPAPTCTSGTGGCNSGLAGCSTCPA